MKRVVSLWLPNFATDRLIRRQRRGQASEAHAALATVTAGQGGLRLAAVSPAAADAGLMPGLSLADARALLPSLTVADADPVGEERALDRLADWCGRYTPWTATDRSSLYRGELGGGGLWLDVSGCAHLFGGEKVLLEDLVARLLELGFTAVAAIADTPGAAWAVARFAAGQDRRRVRIVPAEGAAAAVAPLPVAGLRLPPAVVQDLDRIGLRSVAALRGVPRAPLAARFGESVLTRLDQALGEADEPLSPRRPLPAMIARLAFAEPIGHLDDVVRAAAHLIKDLCARLAQAHQGARRLELAFYLIDGTVSRAAIGASQPTREPVHLQRLFREKLDLLNIGFGIEVATLAALEVEPLAAIQMPLTASRSEPWRSEGLARLIDRLVNRLGADNVNRFVRQASHIPERACREIPAVGNRGNKKTAGGRQDKKTGPGGDQQSRQPRPLILLPWPEPIEVVAPVPDGPPVMFRWGRRQHRVSIAVGPERIAPEWWREGLDPLQLARIRDYYRIEDSDGDRFWIYREGLYRPDIPARWYLHGLFP